MTEWRRFGLMREERDAALHKVRLLEEEVDWWIGEYRRLEADNLDLIGLLAEAKRRHPSSGRS